MIQNILIFIGVILIGYIFYKWATKNDEYFIKRGISYVKPIFLLGEWGRILFKRQPLADIILNTYHLYPNARIIGFFSFRQPAFMLRDPEIVKQLTVTDFDYFEDHQSIIDPDNDDLFGNSLFSLKGQKWRDMRATLSPAFTGAKMRQMFDLINDCVGQMSQYFISKSQNNESMDFDMKEIYSRYTNDVIATCAFGIKINSFEQQNNEFYKMGQLFMKFNILTLIKMIVLFAFPKFMKCLKIQFMDTNIKKFFHSMVIETMEVRDKENIYRPDMINILMQVRKGKINDNNYDLKSSKQDQNNNNNNNNNNLGTDGFATVEESNIGKTVVKRKWNDNEIIAQCFLFFLAGFETSSNMLSFISYELARNPDIQQMLFDEIQQSYIDNGNKLEYDALQKLKYMDMVISETLRLWPPVVAIDRVCVKNYQYDDGEHKFVIEKGTAFSVPIYPFHRDSKYFPNPEKFDPERFNDENRKNIKPSTYLPFGIGPRNCIGSRFALMELKAIIYFMILHFKFEVNDKTQIPLKLKYSPLGMLPEKGVNLTFKLRVEL